MQTKAVSFRLPGDLAAALVRASVVSGRSQANIIEDALLWYMGDETAGILSRRRGLLMNLQDAMAASPKVTAERIIHAATKKSARVVLQS